MGRLGTKPGRCWVCGGPSRVVYTRAMTGLALPAPYHEIDQGIIRRRECRSCGARWTTVEIDRIWPPPRYSPMVVSTGEPGCATSDLDPDPVAAVQDQEDPCLKL